MKTLEQFLLDYLGKSKGYPADKEYLGECLSIAKIYIKECFGIEPPPSGTNSAYGYWSNFPNPLGGKFEKVLNTDDLIPEKGWIAIWKPWASNPYGHIAIVADGCTTGTLKNYAQNWTSKIFQLESNRYTNVIGFLKPKSSIIQDMTEDEKRALELLESYKIANKHGNLEGAVNALVGASNDLKNKTKEIETLEKQIEVDNGAIETLKEQLKMSNLTNDGLKTTISDQYKEMDKKNLEIKSLNEKLTEAILNNNQLINPEDFTLSELFKQIIKRLFKK